jgi:hypothetical protein
MEPICRIVGQQRELGIGHFEHINLTSPASVGTRTPNGPLGCAPLMIGSSRCAGSSVCRRFTVSKSMVARNG